MIPVLNTYHGRSNCLSGKEETDPYKILETFFGDTNLSEVEGLFDKIFQTCLTVDDGPFCKGEERGNLLYMRSKIERVLGACYRIAGEKREANDGGRLYLAY
jgi:hypothetical protein